MRRCIGELDIFEVIRRVRGSRVKSLLASLTVLALIAKAASAQQNVWGGFDLGLVLPQGSTSHHFDAVIAVPCSPTHTGPCAQGEVGWEMRGLVVGVYGGYAVAFGSERRTSIFPRAGITLWSNDKKANDTVTVGIGAGVGLRHVLTRPEAERQWAWRMDYIWRWYPKFTWRTISMGVEFSCC